MTLRKTSGHAAGRIAPLDPVADGSRKKLIAKVHAMAKELVLTDDSYRDVLERITGGRSAALCDDRQLYDVVVEFQRLGAGRKTVRPVADAPMARRARALWMNLWNLDELEEGSEKALASFVKRQTGKEDMRFCAAADFDKVIEALKDMCRRIGAAPATGRRSDAMAWRLAVVREQWARLHAAGWAKRPGDMGLAGFAHTAFCTPNARTVEEMEASHLDTLASKLGRRVRQLKLGRRHSPRPEI